MRMTGSIFGTLEFIPLGRTDRLWLGTCARNLVFYSEIFLSFSVLLAVCDAMLMWFMQRMQGVEACSMPFSAVTY
jgi:hypothetical protein